MPDVVRRLMLSTIPNNRSGIPRTAASIGASMRQRPLQKLSVASPSWSLPESVIVDHDEQIPQVRLQPVSLPI
jgi:hypothetical protein